METPMVPDDRDRSFDKALARHLRPSAPDGPARIDRSQTACPDAETLAAYHERLLSPEQMMSSKQHIAGCSRCQQIVAHLEATDELPLGVDLQEHQGQNVLNMPEPDPSGFAHAAQAPVPAVSRSAGAARVSRLRRVRPGANWRWLAPAGALAAGLLIWVAVHESSPPQFQLTKNQHPAAPSSSSETVSRSAAPGNQEPTSKDAGDFFAVPRASTRAESSARAQNEGSQIEPRNERTQSERAMLDQKTVAPLQAGKLTAPRRDLSPNDSLAPLDRDANRPALPGGIGARAKELKKQAAAEAPAPVPPAEKKDSSGAGQVVTLPPSPKSEAAAKAPAVANISGRQAPQAPQIEQQAAGVPGVLSELRDGSALRMVKARTSVTVTAPGATVLWRIALAGIIEHSTDAGSTWTVQATGVINDLTAGSAPSDKVCWVVGRTGTILRTTDGGEHWLRVRAPIEDDLTAVFAVDAQQATVSSHKTYKTSDAGLTWALLPTP
jgi:hypothetical protein